MVFNFEETSPTIPQNLNRREYPLTERVHVTEPQISSVKSEKNKREGKLKRRKSCVMFKEVEECCHDENAEERLCSHHEELQTLNYEDRQFKLRLKEEMDHIQLKI